MTFEEYGKDNQATVPKNLTLRSFTEREMRRANLIKNALRNALFNPCDFFRVEVESRTLLKTLRGVYKVSPLGEKCIRIIYALS